MELFLIYLWLKLDGFIQLIHVIGVICVAVWGFCWIVRALENLHPHTSHLKSFFKWHTISVWMGCFLITFAAVLPSSKDTAILVGSTIAIDMAKSPEGQKIGSLIRGKVNEFLDKELNKLQPQPTK